ncbi:hypothetical protein TSAR_003407 [Trichomalopsis sarcophagae]|uniref:Uncharacterized protein n=1 Tax=Trichomalopsis sarcophagae TaxID=543379 RepID=A0A232FHX3_9HYME|nr:hypothetical protein TSAR_003407 [Trichomalopsis sarcophagae]
MHSSLSAKTVSQLDAGKKRRPDELKEKVSSKTSGEFASSLPTVNGARRRLRELACHSLFVEPRSTMREELEVYQVCECSTCRKRQHLDEHAIISTC